MQISSYEVGKKYPSAILHQDEIKFDITDGGAIIPSMIVIFDNRR